MNRRDLSKDRNIVLTIVAYVLFPITTLVLFQNCGKTNMTARDVQSIATSTANLTTPTPPKPPTEETYKRHTMASQLVASRILTANFFKSIFGPDLETTITAYIANQSSDFGSANTIYDRVVRSDCSAKRNIYVPCAAGDALKLDTAHTVGDNIRREAYRVRTCHTGVKFRALDALKKIDAKATSAKPPPINDANLTKAFHLFFRGRAAPTNEVLESLTIVSQTSKAPIEQWKDVLLSICLSPHWQVL